MTRRRVLSSTDNIPKWTIIKVKDAEACDVVFANKKTKELIIARENGDTPVSPKEWEPIGIVVIPTSHGVLKDGTNKVNQCGVMSIVPMNCNTPEVGGSEKQDIYWGDISLDITGKSDYIGRYDSYNGNGLINYNNIVVVDKSNPTMPIDSTGYAYMPKQNSIGGIPQWNNSTSCAPSPYAGDDYKSGDLNPAYIATDSPSSSANCLSDFRGIINTKIITDLVTVDEWKSSSTISNSSSSGNYPAACCCARFKTPGTKAFIDCSNDELKEGTGFWYMPSIGELGYVLPKLYDINDTISKLFTAYAVGVQLNPKGNCWSSSEFTGMRSRYVMINNGYVHYANKNHADVVRAFLRLSTSLESTEPELYDSFTLDQSISDPTKMLTGTLGKDGTPETNTVAWIRANSHRYVCTYDVETGMHLKQLDDNDSTKYADGADASEDITTKDVFMKMPTFWFKGTLLDDSNNKYNIHWTNKDPYDEYWTKWDGNTLIGVYKAVCEDKNNNTIGGLFSRSYVSPTGNVSQPNFKDKARNRSNGDDHFMLVTYEAHQVMALLYMCYYGNMNGQAVIGAGTSSSQKVTGATNVDGMKDTVNENSRSINFWGLENWWGDINEWMDNLYSAGSGNVNILDYDSNAVRSVKSVSNGTMISKMLLGEFLDVIPTNLSGSGTTYYCDSGSVSSASSAVSARSYSGSTTNGGPFHISITYSYDAINSKYGSRLLYHGRVVID